MSKQFTFEVAEHIAVLGQNGNTTKELNRVSFAGAAPKYDLRAWQNTPDGIRPLKGITLTGEEAATLKTALNSRPEIQDKSKKSLFKW